MRFFGETLCSKPRSWKSETPTHPKRFCRRACGKDAALSRRLPGGVRGHLLRRLWWVSKMETGDLEYVYIIYVYMYICDKTVDGMKF